jgi:histidyl-tRNA synthetase
MVAQRQAQLTFPLRWWSYGPFWRYERPQRGRTREFFQWNVDILGAESPEADAENVAVLAAFLQRVGLTPKEVLIFVNDRRLMEGNFAHLDLDPKIVPDVSLWIDRRERMSPDAWHSQAIEMGLSEHHFEELQSLLGDRELWRRSPELRRFFAAIDALGVAEFVSFDAAIVRGLTYYTGTVFEAWEVGGEIRRALLGGGRYDNLLGDVGGARLPAVGFAMGDVVMTLLLEKYGLLPPDLPVFPASVLVTLFDNERLPDTLALGAELRGAGLRAAVYTEPATLTRQFKYADKVQASLVLVLGPDEAAANRVTLKDLRDGMQHTLDRSEVVAFCRSLLERHAPQ